MKATPTCQNNHAGRPISHLLILRPTQLNHALGGGVGHVHLPQNTMPIIRDHDPPHRVQQHFQHRTRAECRPDNVSHGLGSRNVAQLGGAAGFALGVGV
jgi:hypothetical protein